MDQRLYLTPGTVLDHYRIERLIGAGGFGVTYEATDLGLGATIAIKEYFPTDLASRETDASVHPISSRHVQDFDWGRGRFLDEARSLAMFKHPNIVEVYRYFEANETAYMVMRFEQGQSMEHWLRGLQRLPTQDELDRITLPMLDALETMHAANLLHRDVAPDNIIVRPNGTPVLLDFGASRQTLSAQTHALTGIFKQGYSPQEQYATDGKFQGPWSDLYALGATLFRAVTGTPPDEATSRGLHDTLPSVMAAAKGDYRKGFLNAIDQCLKTRPAERPQTVREARALFMATVVQPDVAQGAGRTVLISNPVTARVQRLSPKWAIAAAISGLALGIAYAALPSSRVSVLPQTPVQHTAALPDIKLPLVTTPEPRTPAADPVVQACLQARLTAMNDKDARAALDARAACARAYELAPQNAAVARNLGIAMLGEKAELSTAIRLLREAVALRDADAMAELGYLYERGTGVDVDFLQAHALYLQASGANIAAQNRLGVMYELGKGVMRDFASARMWYEKAAAGGASEAMTNLGLMFDHGIGHDVDATLARSWYEKAAAQGNAAAMNNLGTLFEAGKGLTQDFSQARVWYARSADLGDATAMLNIGRMHEKGLGGEIDLRTARAWYDKAVTAGDDAAMVQIGLMYENGVGVARDLSGALRWYERAAKAGNATAMRNLGLMHEYARGVARDLKKARAWYEKSAAGGDASAMTNLGLLFENGRGVAVDVGTARRWYEKAAEAGDGGAMTNLGLLFEQGQGVERDFAKARAYYEKGAQLGDGGSMNNLGVLYENGRGVRMDLALARQWYERAAEAGDAVAMRNLANMYQRGRGVIANQHMAQMWSAKAARAAAEQ